MKIGFIGLGTMGLPMAANILHKSGEGAVGFDVVQAQLDRFCAMGGTVAESAEQVFRCCDITFLSLPNNELVQANLELGIRTAQKGAVVVDLSSSHPAVIQSWKAAAEAAGVGLVDCPVSGGEKGAEAGTLASMCGGREEDVERVRPYLEMFSASVIHMGPLGCGYAAKLANNMIIGTEIAVIAEALNFARLAGLDQQKLFEAIRHGGAASCVLEVKGPKMIQKDYAASSRLSIHLKDQHNAMRLAEDTGAYMPLCAMATEMMEKLEREGRGTDDVAAVLDLFERESRPENEQ